MRMLLVEKLRIASNYAKAHPEDLQKRKEEAIYQKTVETLLRLAEQGATSWFFDNLDDNTRNKLVEDGLTVEKRYNTFLPTQAWRGKKFIGWTVSWEVKDKPNDT